MLFHSVTVRVQLLDEPVKRSMKLALDKTGNIIQCLELARDDELPGFMLEQLAHSGLLSEADQKFWKDWIECSTQHQKEKWPMHPGVTRTALKAKAAILVRRHVFATLRETENGVLGFHAGSELELWLRPQPGQSAASIQLSRCRVNSIYGVAFGNAAPPSV